MSDETIQQSDTVGGVPRHLQRRNLLCYTCIRMLLYLAAPVTYGAMFSVLVDRLGGNVFVANLPMTAMMFMTATPLLVTWLLPQLRVAKWVVVTAFALEAVMGGVVALSLVLDVPVTVRIALLIVHGVILGGGSVLGDVYSWEILSKSMTEESRGKTLATAFSIGPLFAALSSLGQQAVLGGKVSWLSYPNDFAFLFMLSMPVMGLAAGVASFFFVPKHSSDDVTVREPLVSFVFGGLWNFLRQRQFILLILAYLLGTITFLCYDNGQLFMKEAIGVEPKMLAGWATFMRFSGKMLAGILLGLIAARRGARASAATTMLFTTVAVVWILTFRGNPYLGAFAFFGAGELMGVYFPNYCVSASKPEDVKRNLSFFYLLGLIPISAIHGLIANAWGFKVSFVTGIVTGIAAIAVTLMLPHRKPVGSQNAVATEEETT